MSIDLALWLTEHQGLLLPRWVSALDSTVLLHHNGHTFQEDVVPDANGLAAILEKLYTSMILAARGDMAALDVELDHTGYGDGNHVKLQDLLRIAFQFRRIAWEWLRRDMDNLTHALVLGDEIDRLLDHVIDVMVQSWVAHSEALIQEREFIASSLDVASAAADRRALQLTALNRVSQKLSASLEIGELLNLVGTSLIDLLEVAHVAIWLAEVAAGGDAPRFMLRAAQSWGSEVHPVAGMQLNGSVQTDIVLRTYQSGQLVFEIAPDSTKQGDWYQPKCGIIAFPLLSKAAVMGVVVLQDPNPVERLRLQQDLAEGVVNQAAIAIQNARLYEEVRKLNAELEQRVIERTHELKEERDRLSTVHEISTEVSSTLELNNLLKMSLAALARITQAEHGSILLLEKETGHLVNHATLGANKPVYTRFPVGVGIAGWVAQHKKPAMVDDVASDDRWVTLPEGSLRSREGAMVTVPLIMQGEVLGALTLSHRQPGYFNEGHLRLLMASAGAIAIGIHNANLYSEIVEQYERSSELRRRQQTEASQMGAILQSLSDGVIVGDLYGGVLSANPAAGLVLQRDYEELVLSSMHDILKRYLGRRIDEMPLNELLARPLGRNGQPRQFSCDIRHGMQMLRMRLGPVLKEDGELLGALLVIRDITLEIEADRLKTEFIGTMSHELRTPMTAIKGFTQLLGMGGLGPLNDTQREFVNTIYSNTERMIALINDVLDITKIESGSVDLELRPLHLAEALSGVVAELRGLIEGRNHELTITIPPGLPLVRADANRLHQVLYNLLSNATKYTPRNGQIWVEVREAALDNLPEDVRDEVVADRRYTQIDIRDTGVGIEPHELGKVFQRFYRTENPLKIEAGGTGLGLSLVKPLIELLGGKIWVASTPGEGSTFSFILPAA